MHCDDDGGRRTTSRMTTVCMVELHTGHTRAANNSILMTAFYGKSLKKIKRAENFSDFRTLKPLTGLCSVCCVRSFGLPANRAQCIQTMNIISWLLWFCASLPLAAHLSICRTMLMIINKLMFTTGTTYVCFVSLNGMHIYIFVHSMYLVVFENSHSQIIPL